MIGRLRQTLPNSTRLSQLSDTANNRLNAIKSQFRQLEQVAQEKQIQVASLGSLASEVSALYGLKSDASLATVSASDFNNQHFTGSIDQRVAYRSMICSGVAVRSRVNRARS